MHQFEQWFSPKDMTYLVDRLLLYKFNSGVVRYQNLIIVISGVPDDEGAFYRSDMTITPGKQVEECYKTAKRCLNKVNIRNKHLLG
jgi:hypothetical protein